MYDVMIVYWCDILVQVIVGKGCCGVKKQFVEWFEQVIDCVVMKVGVVDMDVYLVEWCKVVFY